MTNTRHIPTLKSLTTLVAATAAFGALAAPAAAKPVPFVGKTSNGVKITFKLNRGSISAILTSIQASCVSPDSRPATTIVQPYTPPGKFHVGTQGKVKATSWPTTNYTVTTQRVGQTRITGKIESNWSLLVPSNSYSGWGIDYCQGVAHFSAKPR